jgi:hypothetical protein
MLPRIAPMRREKKSVRYSANFASRFIIRIISPITESEVKYDISGLSRD